MFDRDRKSGDTDRETSVIDADMRITGTVVSSGDIVLAGGVEGEIKCRHLTVEDQATLNGNVNVEEATIAGQVTGEVTAGVFRMTSTGNFDGIVKADGIEVENGAVLAAKFRKKRK